MYLGEEDMFIGKIPCPDPNYHFRMYYNENACKDSMVLQCHQTDSNGNLMPGMLGKLIFRDKSLVRPGVIAREVINIIKIYATLLGIENLQNDRNRYNYLIKWFIDQINSVYIDSLQNEHV